MDCNVINDNIIYDNKCLNHPTQDILFVCSDCDNEPICGLCITNKQLHRGHNADLLDLDKTTIILNEFKENCKKLDKFKELDIKLGNESTRIFGEIEAAHTESLDKIKKEFNQLRTILNTVEQNTIRQLVTHLDENQEINLKIKSQIEENANEISIIEKYNEANDVEPPISIYDQRITIVKHNQQIKKLLKNETKKRDILMEYTTRSCEFNSNSIETFKFSTNTLVSLNNKHSSDSQKGEIMGWVDKEINRALVDAPLKKERQEIKSMQNLDIWKELITGDKWAAIEYNWYKKWSSESPCYSREELGPINNAVLLKDGEFKADVIEFKDFQMIKEKTWIKLKELYGGGPDIIREVKKGLFCNFIDLRIPKLFNLNLATPAKLTKTINPFNLLENQSTVFKI